MFLMGFNGLFIRLEDEFIGLMEVMDLLKVSEVWRKVDVVREGKVIVFINFVNLFFRRVNSLLNFIRSICFGDIFFFFDLVRIFWY